MDRMRSLAATIGVVRTAVGTALVLAPGPLGRFWVGPDAVRPVTTLLARALGLRAATLGAATLGAASLGLRADTSAMLRLGAMNDLGDAAVTVLAGAHLDPRRRVLAPALAAAFGAVGWVAAGRAAEIDLTDSSPDLPGEIRAQVSDRGVDLRAHRQFRS